MCGIIIGQLVNYIEDDENAARYIFYLCDEFDGSENTEVLTFKVLKIMNSCCLNKYIVLLNQVLILEYIPLLRLWCFEYTIG